MIDKKTGILDQASGPLTTEDAKNFAFEIIRKWPVGTELNAAEILELYPHLRDHKSVMIDLAFEEYTQRIEAGEDLPADKFASQFQSIQKSLQHLLEVNRFLHENSLLSGVSTLADWPESGQRFLDFELVEELGRGAFSRVFLATETGLGDRPVVLKVCLRGGREAQTLGKLQHPNIVPVHSVREDERTGLTAICMPYLSRATMLDVSDDAAAGSERPQMGRIILDAVGRVNQSDNRLPSYSEKSRAKIRNGTYVDGIVSLGIELADALAYTHSQGICHGDLKPSNVLITVNGTALLFDFNLSFLESIDRNNVGGTIPYMAPELLRHLSGDCRPNEIQLDARTDLFALGATLYELLGGRLPFEVIPAQASREQVARDLLAKQRHGPRSLRYIDPAIDPKLSSLIDCCLAFNPDDRPASAAQLATALRSHLSVARSVYRWIRGHKRIAGGILFCAASVIGLAAYAVHESYPDKEYRLGKEAQQRRDLGEAAQHLQNVVAVAPVYPQANTALVEIHLQQGWNAQRRGKSDDAVSYFNQALHVEPDCIDALFARGRAHLQSGNMDQAYEDFKATAEKTDDGRATAYMGYYMNLANKHFEDAIQLYQLAIDQGFESAAVFNNLGFSYLQRAKFNQSEKTLREAIQRNARLQVAFHNLAIVDWRMALRNPQRLPDTTHIETAIEIGPKSALLFLHAANIYAVAAQKSARRSPEIEQTYVDQILNACSHALALNLDPNRLKLVASFYPKLRSLSRYKELADSPAPDETAIDPRRIVNPLSGIDDTVRFNGRVSN